MEKEKKENVETSRRDEANARFSSVASECGPVESVDRRPRCSRHFAAKPQSGKDQDQLQS